MAEASIPVDLLNPGQVFACVGFMEAADILLGDVAGSFDWSKDSNTRFARRATGERNPFEAVLEFLAEAEPIRWAPIGYTDPPPKKGEASGDDDVEGDDDTDDVAPAHQAPSLDLSITFPAKAGDRMALPIKFGGGNRPVIELDHWADGSSRESFKLYAGNRSADAIARAMLKGVRGKPSKKQKANGQPGDLKDQGRATAMGRRSRGARQYAVRCADADGRQLQFRSTRSVDCHRCRVFAERTQTCHRSLSRRRISRRLGIGKRPPGGIRASSSSICRLGCESAAHIGARCACRRAPCCSVKTVSVRARFVGQEQSRHFCSGGASCHRSRLKS